MDKDKGGTQKIIVDPPKFTIPFERRVLIKPDGTEIDYRDLIRSNLMAKKGGNPNG